MRKAGMVQVACLTLICGLSSVPAHARDGSAAGQGMSRENWIMANRHLRVLLRPDKHVPLRSYVASIDEATGGGVNASEI